MLNNPPVAPHTLKVLKRYSELTQSYFAKGCVNKNIARYVDDKPMPPEELAMLKSAGVAFPVVSMTHDQAVEKCFSAFNPSSKNKIARLFVVGLGRSRPDLRSGLSAFAMMQSMPMHRFQPNSAGFCEVCSAAKADNALDLTTLSQDRYFVGALTLARTPYEIQFNLSQQEALLDESPSTSDIAVIQAVLNAARNTGADATKTILQKDVKAIVGPKVDLNQARRIVETLGLCGILQTDEHKGYLERWTNPGLAPGKPSSDWAYPVDFWRGRNGVNEEAVNFWFGGILN